MGKHQWLGLVGFLAGSYTTFHGHRLNKDCWLCQYRGIGWIIAIGGLFYNDYCEKQTEKKEISQRRNYHHSPTPQQFDNFINSQRDNAWENRSKAGSDTWETASNGSDKTIRGDKTNQE